LSVARRRGFTEVEVIDDDLGRSPSGTVARPGVERLVAWLCAGEVGAVLCFDASRLARNGRDWHHLLELVPVKILDDLQPRTTELAIVDFDRTGPSILPTPLRPGGHDNPVILVPNDGLVGFD
jgi:DNA invertase Pin-like site-specific DNA recombinase